MTGIRIIGRVLWSGTKATAWRIWWYQGALALEGRHRVKAVIARLIGTVALTWFIGGTLLYLGWLPYTVPMLWFVSAAVLGDDQDQDPLPSPTEDPYLEDEDAGQSVAVQKGRIGKADVLRIEDPNNSARTHLVWLDQKEAS